MSRRVVSTRRRLCLAHNPASRISLATRLREMLRRLLAQLGMQAWAALSATMSVKLLSNLFYELGIFSFALTGGTLSPGVKATFRDIKHSAHNDNGEFLLVLFDTLLVHLDSREKMPTTFFTRSRSCWTRSSSRLRRRFSSSNGVWCPLPGKASLPC